MVVTAYFIVSSQILKVSEEDPKSKNLTPPNFCDVTTYSYRYMYQPRDRYHSNPKEQFESPAVIDMHLAMFVIYSLRLIQ